MKKKNIKYLVAVLFSIGYIHAQQLSKKFIDGLPELKLPIIIDDITFDNLKSYQIANFSEINNLFKLKNSNFMIEKQDNAIFYLVGKFLIKDKEALLFIDETSDTNCKHNIAYFMILNSELIMESFKEIGWRGCQINTKTSIIFSDRLFEFSQPNLDSKINVNFFKFSNTSFIKGFFPFQYNDCSEENCSDFKFSTDSLPERKSISYNFDKAFFENYHRLIPIKYVANDTISQILTSINLEKPTAIQSFILDSKNINIKGEPCKIVIFLNRIKFKNYSDVQEVGFRIFNSKGKLLKREQLAQYYREKKRNVISIDSAKMFEQNDNLVFRRYNRKENINNEIFTLSK